jgi:hypothetical protein
VEKLNDWREMSNSEWMADKAEEVDMFNGQWVMGIQTSRVYVYVCEAMQRAARC